MQLNEKYEITEKIYRYTNNFFELIHLVFGIELKKFFKRRTTSGTPQASVFDDRPPPELPETSEEAIQFLLNESPDKPYRLEITLKEETFAEETFAFSRICESLISRKISKAVIRKSFFPRKMPVYSFKINNKFVSFYFFARSYTVLSMDSFKFLFHFSHKSGTIFTA